MHFHKQATFEVGSKECGSTVSHLNSEEQARFFEGMAEGFGQFDSGDVDGRQFLHMKDAMSPKTIAFIRKMAEYICEGVLTLDRKDG